MKLDRQLFKNETLQNGINLYFHKMKTSFFEMRIIIPVGNSHSHKDNQGGENGIAHLLEHMIFRRSKSYGKKDAFANFLSLNGATMNAVTCASYTEFIISSPSENLYRVLNAVISQIYEPVFNKNDLEIEKRIIKNESDQRKFYPGYDRLSQYMHSKWIQSYGYSKKQLFGDEKCLKGISAKQLRTFHKNYFSNDTMIILGGDVDMVIVKDLFSKIKTKTINLSQRIEPIKWAGSVNHIFEDLDTDLPRLIIGGFQTEFDARDVAGYSFLNEYLFNSDTGILYRWMREEKGWIYSIENDLSEELNRFTWNTKISFRNKKDLDTVKKSLDHRIVLAIKDAKKLESEVKRQILERVFNYQTLTQRLDIATLSVTMYDRVITEEEYVKYILECTDVNRVREIYEKFFSPKCMKKFIAISKKMS